jgi:hypothetical protein
LICIFDFVQALGSSLERWIAHNDLVVAASANTSRHRTSASGTAMLSVVADDANYKQEQQQ